MSWTQPILERLRALVRRSRVEAEMEEELHFHLEKEAEKYVRAGLSPREARRQAMIAFGGVERFKEATREARGVQPVETLFADLRFALRTLRKSPGFTLVAALTLGLGIGATTVTFSVFNAVVVRPLPFEEPDQLVRIREVTPQGQLMSVSDPNFLDFREAGRAFQEMTAVYLRPLILTNGGDPMRISSMAVTAGFLDMLRVRPSLGRDFNPDEFRRGGEPPVAILSQGFWRSRFGADPQVVGQDIILDGVPRTVIGVLPRDFPAPLAFDVWLPFAADGGFPRGDHRREVFARLAPGVTLEAAREDLGRTQARLGETYPESNGGWGVSVVTFRDWIVGPQATRMAQVLLGAVGLLLLLACASVSNLLVARGTVRRREVALRAALGAGRGRLLGQLLVESLVLAGMGAALGILVAYWTLPLIRALPSSPLPRLGDVSMDGTVLLSALAASVLAALLFGTAPALQGTKWGVMDALKVGGLSSEPRTRRLRDGLVVGQLALATVLLVGAGLLASSFLRMAEVDPGFDTEGVLLVEVSAPADRYPEMAPQTSLLYRQLAEAAEGVPGVVAAGATMASPVSSNRPSNFVARSDRAEDRGDFLQIQWRSVTPGFFRALGVPLLEGRPFEEGEADAVVQALMAGDTEASVPVVIGRSLAQSLWPEDDPVGRYLVWGGPGGTRMRVVGVAGDIRDLTFPMDPQPAVYLPHRLAAWPTMTLVIRTRGEPAAIAREVRTAIWNVEPNLPVPEMRLMDDALGTALAGPRLNLSLMAVFSLAALLLAAVGLYGLTAYSAARQTREIGVRLALGAPGRGILRLILARGMALAMVGTLLGLGGALLVTRFMASILFGVTPGNPSTYVLVAFVLGSVTVLAALLPAVRATRVNPVTALKAE